MPRLLESQVAVVTGASSGIGRAIALELAAAGAAVLVHAGHNRRGVEETAAGVEAAGGEARIETADLADGETWGRLVEAAWSWRSKIDIWVNNAGADVLTGSLARLSFDEKLQRLWSVDAAATIGLSRAAGRRMKLAGRGAIVNIGWDGAERGMAGDSGEMFAAVKGAVMAFTRSLAQSLAPEVRVNCVAPGWIKTAWGAAASDYWQRRATAESLLGRWGSPEDVARAVRFLASPEADFLTGQVLHVNGGFRIEPTLGPRPSA